MKSKRDGLLVIVSDDLSSYLEFKDMIYTLQMTLENWENVRPKLRNRYESSCLDPKAAAEKSDASLCAALLPRIHQRVDGSVYLKHAESLR